ncbi:MAG: hypothetical protein ACI4AW_07175 [Paludibacteraceae bacterium]
MKPSVTPEVLLERRKALAALVLFVGSRYYLRPIILWNHLEPFGTPQATGTPKGLLEQPQAPGTRLGATGTPAGLIAATRIRVCGDNAMNVR